MLIPICYGLLMIGALIYMIHAQRPSQPWGRLATTTALMAWAALTAGLVRRGQEAGHWPLTNAYEFALIFTWMILSIHLLLEASTHDRRPGAWIMGVAILTATYALTRPIDQQSVRPLLPALRSVWLQLHVLSAAVAYGAFGVAAGIAVMLLVGKAKAWNETNPNEPEAIKRNMERAAGLGFPFLTLSILTGGIWAQNAWGRYWGWDPKESWALITWLWFLLVLHVRPLRTWRGRRLAALVVGGFVLVIFTFIGVPWLVRTVRLESLHGF